MTAKDWLSPVAERARRNGRADIAGIRVADGLAYATDGHILLATPAGSLRRNVMQKDVERSAWQKPEFREGKWLGVSWDEASRSQAVCWRKGTRTRGLRVVGLSCDDDGIAIIQARLIHDALKGLDLTRLSVAAASPLSPIRLTDGKRHAWVMPVRIGERLDVPLVLRHRELLEAAA